jgi:hypothetical protein
MNWLRIAGIALLLGLGGCVTEYHPTENLRVATPCAPDLVSLAVLF